MQMKKDPFEKYRCEAIEALCPPKYKCCGHYYHTQESLAIHVKHAHPDIYAREFGPVLSARTAQVKPAPKKRKPRIRREYYNGEVFVCSRCHKPHSEGWILHYAETGEDKLVCSKCNYNMTRHYARIISVPMGGKAR